MSDHPRIGERPETHAYQRHDDGDEAGCAACGLRRTHPVHRKPDGERPETREALRARAIAAVVRLEMAVRRHQETANGISEGENAEALADLDAAHNDLIDLIAPHGPDAGPVRARPPSRAEIDDACMWYRRDFGILFPDVQDRLRVEARKWLRAWCKVRDYEVPAAPTPDAEPVAWLVEDFINGLWRRVTLTTSRREAEAYLEAPPGVPPTRIVPLYRTPRPAAPVEAVRSDAPA